MLVVWTTVGRGHSALTIASGAILLVKEEESAAVRQEQAEVASVARPMFTKRWATFYSTTPVEDTTARFSPTVGSRLLPLLHRSVPSVPIPRAQDFFLPLPSPVLQAPTPWPNQPRPRSGFRTTFVIMDIHFPIQNSIFLSRIRANRVWQDVHYARKQLRSYFGCRGRNGRSHPSDMRRTLSAVRSCRRRERVRWRC